MIPLFEKILPFIKVDSKTLEVKKNNLNQFKGLIEFYNKEIFDIVPYEDFIKLENFLLNGKKGDSINVDLLNGKNYDIYKAFSEDLVKCTNLIENDNSIYLFLKETEKDVDKKIRLFKKLMDNSEDIFYFVYNIDEEKVVAIPSNEAFINKFLRYGEDIYKGVINYFKLINFDKKELGILLNNNITSYTFKNLIKINEEDYKLHKKIITCMNQKYISLRFEKVSFFKEKIDKLEELAKKDALTGAYNRTGFYEKLENEIKLHRIYEKRISFVLLDLDNFKKVNDSFGHDFGDLVLQYFVDVIKKNLRKTDFLARFGGEEFLVLLPLTRKEQAISIAERIRKDIEERMRNFMGRTSITASVGVTTFSFRDKKELNFDEIYKTVDEALYLAKDSGKNRVVFKNISK